MQAVVHHFSHHLRRVTLSAGKIRTAYVADKQRVAGQQFLRFVRSAGIRYEHADAFGCVARSLDKPQDRLAHSDLFAITYRSMIELDAGSFTKDDLCACAGSDLLVTADEIRVQVRLN